MYLIVEQEDVIRIPPPMLGEDLDRVVEDLAREKIEGNVYSFPREEVSDPAERKYIIVLILSLEKVGEGIIVPGDGAVYQKVRFKALAFHPELQEVVIGDVVDVLKFGAFVRFGPIDGLLHISQIMDDVIDVDLDNKRFVGKESKRNLKVKDKVLARVVALSINDANPRQSKIGLTMRQPGLGKLEWIEEQVREGKK
ncbi:DNA-directed RNA polymerase subunit E' [Aciduliprofundum sp. MAR08-339]|uniref:DNA-directed RNA polymerase n=1 Tax=Aciduliprofundum sp. (strain MAR08-339) TaxID=673860 RepID=UPI0002A4B5DD|nr:DNA-directed RNA polymerase subunit E' [Aciduliprofundum sp. MAR08-339]